MSIHYHTKKPRAAFTLLEILIVFTLIGILLNMLLPAFGAARQLAREQVNAVNMAGLVKTFIVYSSSNNNNYPGLSPKRELENSNYGTPGSGYYTTVAPGDGTVEGATNYVYALLLEENYLTSDSLVSPVGNAEVARPGNEVVGDNSSYALLNYLELKLRDEWNDTSNSQALVVRDRVIYFPANTYTGYSSNWTLLGSGRYKSKDVFNDSTAKSTASIGHPGLRYGAYSSDVISVFGPLGNQSLFDDPEVETTGRLWHPRETQ